VIPCSTGVKNIHCQEITKWRFKVEIPLSVYFVDSLASKKLTKKLSINRLYLSGKMITIQRENP